MKLSTDCLEASQVDSLLQGNLTPEEYEAAQDHLELCETCRARVEATIGPAEWWSDVQNVLLNSRTGACSQRNAFLTDAEPNERSTAKLLDLLGPTDDPNMLGRIGPYEIIGLLGQGGMGAVFKGFDRALNRFVAIKMLLPHLAASGAARKRFAREGQAVAAVVDDHVMAIHCVDEWQGVPYLVMTYSRGVSLQKRLSDNGPLEVREILRIGMQAAKGLAAAHAQGIVHRDIKPANIFLDQNVERVQLMDFGLARAVDDASLTRSGTLAGTPQYMSPEQARAETVDHRSDLFSLGSVMYAMCTGHAPFRADSSYSVLRLITDKEPRPIHEVNPDVPEWLCTIIRKLMAKQASERYQSAKEVSELLEDCLAHVQHPTIKKLPRELTNDHVPQPHLFCRTGRLLEIQMPKRDKFYARLAVALLVTAFLVPIVIAAFSNDFYAVIFFGFAMAIAVLFALVTWRHRSSKYVVSVAGLTGCIIAATAFLLTYPTRWQLDDAEASFQAIAAEHEATFERALNQRKYEDGGQAKKSPSPKKRTFSFESPFQGRVHWGNRIRENVFLQKGEVIAEIIGFDPDTHRQLSGQLSLLKQKAEAEATLVQASEESLKVYRANVEALESRLKVYEQEGQTNEEKRQVDIDSANAALSKAKAAVAKSESDLQKARFDLNVTQKEVADLEAKLVEQKSYVFHAPSSGYVTDLCLNELLKKGDVICLFDPESEYSPPTKPLANGESDKAEQGVGASKTGPR